jgi:hypothetical protein
MSKTMLPIKIFIAINLERGLKNNSEGKKKMSFLQIF